MAPVSILAVAGMVAAAGCLAATTTAYRIRTCTGRFLAHGISARLGYNQVGDACYTDIQALWGGRRFFLHQMPYLHLPARSFDLAHGGLEYPVVTGMAAWLTAHFVRDDRGFLVANAVLLIGLLLVAVALLARLAGSRAWIAAVGTPAILWSVYNWDVISMAATMLGVAAWLGFRPRQTRAGPCSSWFDGYPLAAGILLGIGTATKLYPAIFLLPLALDRLHARDGRSFLRLLGGAAAAWLVVNLPFVALNPWGWAAAYLAQAHRAAATYDNSIWWYLHLDGRSSLVYLACFAMVAGAVLAWSWNRSRSARAYPWMPVCLLLLALPLLCNRVASPQYIVWLVPFIVLADVPASLWLTYMAVDGVAFAAYYGRLDAIPDLNEACVFAKALVLVGIVVFAGRRAGLTTFDRGTRDSTLAAVQVH